MAPCWENITPGTTNRIDVEKIIANPDLVIQDTIRTASISGRDDNTTLFSGYQFRLVSDGSATVWLPSIETNDNIVFQIDIKPSDLQFGDVIESYGIPSHILVNDHVSSYTCYEATLFYPEKGILVLVQGCPDEGSPIHLTTGGIIVPNNARVGQITFYVPQGSLRLALIESLRYNESYADYVVSSVQTWEGFDFPYRVTEPRGPKY